MKERMVQNKKECGITPKEKNVHTNTKKLLSEEIRMILERNQDERFLRKLLTRALILEELMR